MMIKGDIVLINYNTESNLQKVATFLGKQDNNNMFRDIDGIFGLSDNFIKTQGIIITVMED